MNKEYYLYRHYNDKGELLYVGLTVDPIKRTYSHSVATEWYPEVKTITIENVGTCRGRALILEMDAIEQEGSKYNVVGVRPRTKKPKERGPAGKTLQEYRRDNMMTYAQLAKFLNKQAATVWGWCNGKIPNDENIKYISRKVGRALRFE
jgi:hypothetical protein